jgi:hypothetical protein
MCKHVAATLYGVGARFDSEPELLFRLRGVDPEQLIRQAGNLPGALPGVGHDFGDVDLSALFGIDLEPMTMQNRASSITSKQLGARGIPAYVRQNWLTAGILLRTGQRGVYGVTARTEPSVARYLDREKK